MLSRVNGGSLAWIKLRSQLLNGFKGVIMASDEITDQVAKFVISCNNEVLKEMTVSSIARRFHVDRSHLAREFKSGKNFTIYVIIEFRYYKLSNITIFINGEDFSVMVVAHGGPKSAEKHFAVECTIGIQSQGRGIDL